jgi:hypothetical protein
MTDVPRNEDDVVSRAKWSKIARLWVVSSRVVLPSTLKPAARPLFHVRESAPSRGHEGLGPRMDRVL